MERNWLEERNMQPRWNALASSMINLLVLFAAFFLLWRVFMDPTGYLRMYTPMYGFSYIQWLLIAVLVTVLMANYWPMKQGLGRHPLYKGSVLFAGSLIASVIFVNIFVRGILGNVGVPYFSPDQLTGLGMSSFLAREYASAAALFMGAVMGLAIPLWVLHFNNWPAAEIPRFSGRLTSFLLVLGGAFASFFIIIHPHFGVLFYPWQKYTAAFPWWEKVFGTLSGNFNLGWIMCWTVAIWLTEIVMKGYPFKLIQRPVLRSVAGIFGTLGMGLCMFFGFVLLQEIAWGAPVRGAKLMMAPDWRYLHAGETAVFMLVAALIWSVYFKNWPEKFSAEINILVRFVVVGVVGVAFYNLYYRFNWMVLGTQPGYAHPSQFPLAPLTLLILLLLVHDWYFDKWPGEKAVKVLK